MMKRILPILLLLFLVTALTAGEESLIARKTMIVSLSSTDLELNPVQSFSATEAQLFSGLYEGLVTYHPFTLDPLPGAAARWDISADGKTYRFYLRDKGLYWNGDPVTAMDFRETWLMLLEPEEKAPYSFLLDGVKGAKAYRTGASSDPETVAIRVIDPLILEVELDSPADHFLKILCHHSFTPLHPAVRETIKRGEKAPGLGNGPFYVYSRDQAGLIFLRNELYWDVKNVELKEIRILFEDDEDAAAEKFNQGEIHWSLGNINYEKVENRQSLVVNPLFATTYYFFSTKEAPFDNPKIRRALSLLLPWKEIRSEDYYYIPAQTLIPALDEYPEPEGIAGQDRETAHKLLEEEGFPRGKGLPVITLRVPRGTEETPAATFIRDTWIAELETPVEFDVRNPGEYYSSLKETGYTLGILTWIGDFADPLTFLQMWASDSNLNDGGYNNPEYDSLLEEAARQIGPRRMKTLSQSETLLLEEGTVLPISHQPAFNVVDLTSLDGWYPNPLDIHPFKYMSFSIPQVPSNVVMAAAGR